MLLSVLAWERFWSWCLVRRIIDPPPASKIGTKGKQNSPKGETPEEKTIPDLEEEDEFTFIDEDDISFEDDEDEPVVVETKKKKCPPRIDKIGICKRTIERSETRNDQR